ncbi:helix-turn-helix transcriptional regulator [Actinophytocola sp.]|uniref:helix-turn-helix domain-containing protein n=1 Tax=Actinophytocola sp. TaxID=1872138 RepID=UPI002D7EE17A|nr:helix-turn-helix transcriptional regulator [Actinophytocola sp.]HET9141971.1 helix-turn-helix transcriptional regulator [Actinophytocola sp.]
MGQRETSVVRQRRLRAELRRFREEACLTQKGVAEALGWSTSKMVRLENGSGNVSTSDVMALLHYYRIDDTDIAEKLLAATRNLEKGWWEGYRGFMTPQFLDFLGYEASATRIRQYMGQIVPGLLQTEEYARALLVKYAQPNEAQVDRGVRIRMRRQEILNHAAGPELLFVLDEDVIHRWVGGADLMVRQLARLKDLARHPRISIQIVPFSKGVYVGMHGSSFTIFEFSSHDYVVALEDPDRDLILGPETSSCYLEKFLAVQQLACHDEEEVDRIIDPVIDRMRLGAMV